MIVCVSLLFFFYFSDSHYKIMKKYNHHTTSTLMVLLVDDGVSVFYIWASPSFIRFGYIVLINLVNQDSKN